MLAIGTSGLACSNSEQPDLSSPNVDNMSEFMQNTAEAISDAKDKLHRLSNDGKNTNANAKPICFEKVKPFVHSICTVSRADLSQGTDLLRLFWKPTGTPSADKPLYTFDNLLADLPNDTTLKFAMNAGMYNAEFAPIGYTVMDGEEVLSLNLNEGGGNFHLMPNGVFWWEDLENGGKVHVTESKQLSKMLDKGVAKPEFATQSGPMLVIDGQIHPKFDPQSQSLKIRNGVGVCSDGSVQFVISDEPVNFYNFARLFRDDLDCPNALFLDGGIASALYAPDIDRNDGKNIGVMVGLVEVNEE